MRAASARALLASSNFWSRSYSTAGLEAGGAGGGAGGRMRVAEGVARRLRALIRNIESIRCRGTPPKLATNRQTTRRCVAGRQRPRAARWAGRAHPSQGPCRAATGARTFCARPATRRTTFSWRVRRAGAPLVLLAAASYRSTVVDDPDRQRAICAPIARFLSQLRAQLLRRRIVPEKRLEINLNSMWRLLVRQSSPHDALHESPGAQIVCSGSARPDASCERSSTPRKRQFLVAVVLNCGARSARGGG